MASQADYSGPQTVIPGELTGYRLFESRSNRPLVSINGYRWEEGVNTAACYMHKAVPGQVDQSECCSQCFLIDNAEKLIPPDINSIRVFSHYHRCPRETMVPNYADIFYRRDYRFTDYMFTDYRYVGGCHGERVYDLEFAKKHHDGDVPRSGCQCGFYAAYDLTYLTSAPGVVAKAYWEGMGAFGSPGSVRYYVGVVKASGRILLGEHGFRAEKMRIVGLLANCGGVVVDPRFHTFRSVETMEAEYPPESVKELIGA